MNTHCIDMDTMREYCWYNNRTWSDDAWERAKKVAMYTLANDSMYLSSDDTRRAQMLNEATCMRFYSSMNMVHVYRYTPNITEDGAYKEYNPNSVAGTLRKPDDDAEPDDEDLLYSAKWNGMYRRREIEWLDAKYENYMAQHNLDTEHLQDAAKKQCALALIADDVMQRYRNGGATLDDVNKVMKMYDDSAKSNMFAACKRKPGEAEGATSFSEMAAKLQSSGKIEAVKIKWAKDAVDAMLDEYYGLAAKMGRDGVFT